MQEFFTVSDPGTFLKVFRRKGDSYKWSPIWRLQLCARCYAKYFTCINSLIFPTLRNTSIPILQLRKSRYRDTQWHLVSEGAGIGFQVFLTGKPMLLVSLLYCINILGWDFFRNEVWGWFSKVVTSRYLMLVVLNFNWVIARFLAEAVNAAFVSKLGLHSIPEVTLGSSSIFPWSKISEV